MATLDELFGAPEAGQEYDPTRTTLLGPSGRRFDLGGGRTATELGITVTEPALNGGRPTNIPLLTPNQPDLDTLARTVGNGGPIPPEAARRAVEWAAQRGGFPSYGSIDEAVAASKARSAEKGTMLEAEGRPQGPLTTVEELFSRGTVPELRAAPAVTGYPEEPTPPEPGYLETYGPMALRLGGRVLGGLVGLAAGQPVAGGAIGAGAGELGARYLEQGQLGRADVLPTAVAAVGGAIQPGPLPTLGETAAREALLNYGQTAASTLAERGQLPSGAETLGSVIIGGAGGALMGRGAAREAAAEARGAEDVAQLGRLAEPGAETPVVGQARTLEELFGPQVETPPTPTPEGIVLPGPTPQPNARILSPSGEPFPSGTADRLRAVLERRGLAPEEVDRILSETAPPEPPGPSLILPSDLQGGEETAGQALAREAPLADLRAGVAQAQRPGPTTGGPTVLPYRKGEELGMPASPLQDALEAAAEPLPAPEVPTPAPEPGSIGELLLRTRGGAPPAAEASRIITPSDFTSREPVSVGETLSAVRAAEAARAAAAAEQAAPTSPGTLITSARDLAAKEGSLAEILKSQRGAIVGPLIRGAGGAAAGGAVGYTVGDTDEERRRNALLGAAVGAAGGLGLGALLGRQAPAAASAAEQAVTDLGQAARTAQQRVLEGDFAKAHEVADAALGQLDLLRSKIGEVSPENRLFRVVHDALAPPSPGRETSLATVTGAGQLLQRYSDLAQRLKALAADGDAGAAQLLDRLYTGGEDSWRRQLVNLWRGSLVGKISTATRNALDQGTILSTHMLDRLGTGVAEGVMTGHPLAGAGKGLKEFATIGATAARRLGEGLAGATHLAAVAPDRLQAAFDRYPELAARVLSRPDEAKGWLGSALKAVNKFNEVQENFFRKTLLESTLVNELRAQGIDPVEALRNPDMIPADIAGKAADTALKGTLAYRPDGRIGSAVAEFFHKVPEAHLVMPFPRYLANRLQFTLEHSPLGLVRLFTQGRARAGLETTIRNAQEELGRLQSSTPEALGLTAKQFESAISKASFTIEQAAQSQARLDTNPEIIGKFLTGTAVPLVAGMTLRSPAFGGEHWYEIKKGDQRIDMRPYSTLAGFMFLGELAKEIQTSGTVTMPEQDMVQGLALLGTRSGIGLTILDTLSGRGGLTYDNIVSLGADLAAMIPSGFFNPIAQLKDVAAFGEQLAGQEHPPEAIQRTYRDTALQRLYGPSLAQIPFASRYLPERPLPTRGTPAEIEQPAAHFFGVNIQTPNPVEQKMAELGMDTRKIAPSDQDKQAVREMTAGMGKFVGDRGVRELLKPGFAQLPAARQELTIGAILRAGRSAGLADLARQDRERALDVLRRRRPQAIQELLQGR